MRLVVILMFAHVPLGLLLKKAPGLSTYHALATLIAGCIIAYKCRAPVTVAYLAAYIAGFEVIWRMTKSKMFTEWGKFTLSVFVIIAVLRFTRTRRNWLALLYFALLLPAAGRIFGMLPWDEFKEAMTFTLSGPFALMACMYFFSGLKINSAQFLRLMLAVLMPILAISAIAAFTTVTAEDLDFSANVRNLRSATMSGGFGPNQVSSILGMGVLAAFLVMMHEEMPKNYRPVIFVILAGLASQAALTFSRTGLYLATGSIVAAAYFYMGDAKMRPRILRFGFAMVGAVAVVLPLLSAFTGGALLERFKDISTTGRDNIMFLDLKAFALNPLLGIGVDQGPGFRAQWMGVLMESHVEWSRMLGEHGVFGLVALIILIFLGWKGYRSADTLRARSAATSLLVFTVMYASSCGMRLGAPSFLFGLLCTTWKFGPPKRRPRPRLLQKSPFATSPEFTDGPQNTARITT